MVAPEKESVTLGLAGFAGAKRLSPAPYKRLPVHPLLSPAVNLAYSNHPRLRVSCTNCFPQPLPDFHQNYVDLLEFSKAFNLQKAAPEFAIIRVNAVMRAEQARNPSVSLYEIKRKVSRFYYEIRATLSRFICKICGYLLFKVFRRLMTRLLVCPQQMKRLIDAEKTGTPLVYLPLHRSHLDYLLITWTSWHFGLRLPHIASGDNLNLSGLGWLLRATGAFFIRRRIDEHDEGGKDAVYRAVLHSYIEQLLKKGLPIEFFLEGTRCRFGKPLLPKHGLISNVVTAVQQKVISDCYLVPVSYTYDNVAEGVFLDELMGIPKKRESVLGIATAVVKSFGMPKRELVPWHTRHREKADDRSLIRAIGYHVLYEAQSIVSISLVSIVSALLMCKFRQSVAVEVLSADCQWLCDQIVRDGSDVMGWHKGETCGRNAVESVAVEVLSADCQWLCDQIVRDGSDVMGWHKGETCGRNAVEYALQYLRDSVERFVDPDAGVDNVVVINTHRQLPCEDLRALIAVVVGRSGLSHIDYGMLRLEGDEEDEIEGEVPIKLESTHLCLLEAVNSDSFRNSLRFLRYKAILSSDSKHFDREQAEEIRMGLLRMLEIQ
ncbi:Acyltransferase [Ancylostoma ceylanicum]|uniref:Acyltransferase n=1 Tax=Ancylostoma ceylanicum TaxID=53326 RepID=A0A0D6LNF3_9BILA|nr:Acyltransferase [Ancylostoma ceylanicum]